MSSGHRHIHVDHEWAKKEYHAALGSEKFRSYLFDSKFKISRDYDIPYVAGYSKDGRVVFIDRHLPMQLRIGGTSVSILPFIITHERTEKGLIDFLGLDYDDAHKVATWREHKELVKAHRSPTLYERALDPYIKADQHEKIRSVPETLDLKPYRDSGDIALLNHMKEKMVTV